MHQKHCIKIDYISQLEVLQSKEMIQLQFLTNKEGVSMLRKNMTLWWEEKEFNLVKLSM